MVSTPLSLVLSVALKDCKNSFAGTSFYTVEGKPVCAKCLGVDEDEEEEEEDAWDLLPIDEMMNWWWEKMMPSDDYDALSCSFTPPVPIFISSNDHH